MHSVKDPERLDVGRLIQNLNQLGHWITISIQIGSDTSLGMKTVQSDHTPGDSMS